MLDVVDLREFYISPLGRVVRSLLRDHLVQIWPDVSFETLLAVGYATPFLRPFYGRAHTLLAMMPASQGVAYWPREGPNISCLTDLSNLPLSDESISRTLLVHALESAADAPSVLEEAWRVLQPGGRMLLVVANRRGFWAHCDHTPFGTGEPYSLAQIKALLRDQGFLIEQSSYALYAPPWRSRMGMMIVYMLDRLLRFFGPAFGGVLIVEASKQLYAPLTSRVRRSSRRLVLPLSFPKTSGPVPTNRT